AVLTEALKQKRFRAFFVSVLSVSVSAAGRFFFLLPDSFFFSFLFLLLSFVPFLLTRTAFRNAPGDVFSGKESHSSPELSDALKTYEN
ncbi:hypothetical protein, partial [Phocaeicola plebeius]|uniref:hypothetical protein n=1 Tax=Phocaeicola plebeius TaxID=310297 RepID=UPI0026EDC8B5